MTRAWAIGAALLCAATARAKAPTVRGFDSPAEALRSILGAHPRVIAFGEFHEIKGAAKVKSAIARFTDELLAEVAGGASDLIVETWVTEGNCGREETQVTNQVQETTQRPESTESELVTLLKRAKAQSVQPSILTLSCAGYRALLSQDGEVDYEKLLATVTDLLQRKIAERLRAGAPDKTILVYGGALHNDLFPRKELRAYSFAPSVMKATRGRYLEIDLYVPEYIEHDKELTAEPWYPRVADAALAKKVALVRRSANSYIIVFARTP
jgi:hypothetical protein